MINAAASTLPFMKATYSYTLRGPLVRLPPEMLERVYMCCTEGRLSVQEVRQLYAAGVLLGMAGITNREIVHQAVEKEMPALLYASQSVVLPNRDMPTMPKSLEKRIVFFEK